MHNLCYCSRKFYLLSFFVEWNIKLGVYVAVVFFFPDFSQINWLDRFLRYQVITVKQAIKQRQTGEINIGFTIISPNAVGRCDNPPVVEDSGPAHGRAEEAKRRLPRELVGTGIRAANNAVRVVYFVPDAALCSTNEGRV